MRIHGRKTPASAERGPWPHARERERETAHCWVSRRTREWFRSFFVWPGPARPGPDTSAAPDTIDHTVGERHRGTSGRGGVEEVRRLSLPWSPMAPLTIQHPPNYPPVHSHRDKASVLVCWSNMATNLSPSSVTFYCPCESAADKRATMPCLYFHS